MQGSRSTHGAKPHRLRAALIGIALVGPLLAACGGGNEAAGGADSSALAAEAAQKLPGVSPDLIKQAQEEGKLSLYRLGYAFDKKIFKEFNRLFPEIKIESYEATVPELIQRYSAEARSGRHVADVVMATQVSTVKALDQEKLVTHYTPVNASKFSPGYVKDVLYPFSQIRLCNAYNSDLVKENEATALETWDGILDNRWQGKAGMVKFGGGGVQLLPYYFVEKKQGDQFLNKMLSGQKPLLVQSVPSLTEKLAAGGIETVFFANDGNLNTLYAQGAPVRWKCPSPALVQQNFQFIGKDAPNPSAAKLWIEFITSEYGQGMVIDSLGLGNVYSDLQDSRPAAKESWFKAPTDGEPFSINWDEVPDLMPKLQAKVDSASSGLKSE
jgi:iron(III) transport system substrate-binding protein